MLTRPPGLILPATPVAASIMMAISCSPDSSSGRSDIMSAWSSEPLRSLLAAILPRTSARSVTAVRGSQRSGIGHLLELVPAEGAVGRNVVLQLVGRLLRTDLGLHVTYHRQHAGERGERAQDGEDQKDDAAALA